MKNISRKFLMISLTCILLGSILMAIGYISGGFQDIRQLTAPKKVTKQLKPFTRLDFSDNFLSIHVETGPVKVPTVTYYKHPKFITPIKMTVSDETLTLSKFPRDMIISGAIEAYGFYLDSGGKDYNSITITLPKETVLKEIKGTTLQTLLSNITVQDLQLVGFLVASDTTIHNANINGYLNATKSQFDNITVESQSDSYVADSIINKGHLSLTRTTLITKNSQLKSVVIDSSQSGGVEAKNTTFEKLKFTGLESQYQNDYSNDEKINFISNNTTFKDNNQIIGGNVEVTLSLTSTDHISYDFKTKEGKIITNSAVIGDNVFMDPLTGEQSLHKEHPNALEKININLSKGNIMIK